MPYLVRETPHEKKIFSDIPEYLSTIAAYPLVDEYEEEEEENRRKRQKRSTNPTIQSSILQVNKDISMKSGVASHKKDVSVEIVNDHIDDITDHEPHIGMQIDFRDDEFIWSSASIVTIHQPVASKSSSSDDVNGTRTPSFTSLSVTVRYDGWPAEHDEIVEWTKSPRIAKVFTFTRRVKCLARLLPSNRKSHSRTPKITISELWPCRVYFRMPHPEDRLLQQKAEELLGVEPNILIQPYGIDENILPKLLSKVFTQDFKTGRWMSTTCVVPWRSNIDASEMDLSHANFSRAMKLALADSSTPGCLEETQIFESKSLLIEKYRIQSMDCLIPLKGQLIPTVNQDMPIQSKSKSSDPNMIVRKYTALFPGGINIPNQVLMFDKNEIFPSKENPEKFSVQMKIGENDLFLGEYPSKSTALEALQCYRGTHPEGLSSSNASSQVIRDIHAITPGTAISVWKSNSMKDKKSSFSPKEWARAYIEKAIREPLKWEDPIERAFPLK